MTPVIVLALFVGLPVLVGIVLRVNAIYLYTSLVVGELLVRYVGDDAALAASGFTKSQYSQMISSLFLLLIPMLITILLLRRTAHASQILFQLPALIAAGASLYIFAVPLLTGGVIGSILLSPIGKSINTSQDIIIAASGVIIVSTMWLTSKPHGHKRGKHHK